MEKSNNEVLSLLKELENIIETSPNVPFGSRIMINREEILEIIKNIRIGLPSDVKQAEFIQKEKEKIINKANEEAKKMVETTEEFCKKSASEHEISKLAKQNAQEIIENANNNAEAIKEGAREYSVQMLEKLSENLEKMLKRIEMNKNELQNFEL